jgi:chromosome segregation ATPase
MANVFLSSPGFLQDSSKNVLKAELTSAKKAVEVLKEENAHTQAKLEKVLVVLERERGQLREVLEQAKNAVEQVKSEKRAVEEKLEVVIRDHQTCPGVIERHTVEIQRVQVTRCAVPNRH